VTDWGGLRLELPARPESLADVRRAVVELARELGLGESVITNLAVVVSEACANVVKYAYRDGFEGLIEVEVIPAADILRVFVRDQGDGIRPQPESSIPSAKLGLPMIGALSRRFRLTSERGRGTELEVELPRVEQR
jgi:anti-sigma regulatory factor (Ser/Thr protein kinase)